MSRELAHSIQQLYEVFARYGPRRVHSKFEVSKEEEDKLVVAPLTQLTWDELQLFARKALTTWGNVSDLRHFLPRILELLALEKFNSNIDPEIAVGKLQYGDWRSWPIAEQNAIEQYLSVLWLEVLVDHPSPYDLDTSLCCIGQVVDDLKPFLDRWKIETLLPAALHFADLVESAALRVVRKGRTGRLALHNAFWSSRPDQANQVIEWVLDPQRQLDIERAFNTFAMEDDDLAGRLSGAFDHLRTIQANALPTEAR